MCMYVCMCIYICVCMCVCVCVYVYIYIQYMYMYIMCGLVSYERLRSDPCGPPQMGFSTTDEMCLSFMLYYPEIPVHTCWSTPDQSQNLR